MALNKKINKIKLAITTRCNLSCDYCFVKKTKEEMGLATAEKAVELLTQSQGADKLLSIYGGEPLLNFTLIEKICPYAIREAKKLRKNLVISLCTNSTLLAIRHLLFFKKYNIRLIISMFGNSRSHDKFRRFYSDKGSYEAIVNKLPSIFKILPAENIGVSFCVSPSLADRVEENFMHLTGLGFKYINIEIVREFENWTPDAINKFSSGLKKIIRHIFSEIPRKNFIFLNPVNWQIKYRALTQYLHTSCPFNYKLEVYPNGMMAFSPFLLNSAEKENYVIGNINGSFYRYRHCRFSSATSGCRRCECDYFKGYDSDAGASKAYRLYLSHCRQMAERLQDHALKSKISHDYVRQIKQKICY